MEIIGSIYSINGPVIKIKGSRDFQMLEMVYVGRDRLVGEVISIDDYYTVVQVYESTAGLKVGEPVFGSQKPMSVTLGPGIIGNIFDGIERPLNVIMDKTGSFIERGISVDSLDTEREWEVEILVKPGDIVSEGSVVATVSETEQVTNKVMVPYGVCGVVKSAVPCGKYNINATVAQVEDKDGALHDIKLSSEWPIRVARPYRKRSEVKIPLVTGQRILDTLFPVAKGGTAAIPGGFGTGKTMLQHQLAKWCDADIIVYIGCGERGNEMTQVLEEFSSLIDPKTGTSLMSRTVLIANTSNMPVAAREASIYTGITIAEYYRDMGYHVAVMADSTSRWAEALREISGRLEEMPAEEGFPAYLSSRLAGFYERSGYITTLGGEDGSVTIIGAVSPQGGDFSEPVTQNTKRFVRTFWALDRQLAYARHYPAINWLTSYSEYIDELHDWYKENVDEKFFELRAKVAALLQEESELTEIVKLIGSDVLPDSQKLVLEIAKVIRTGFLQQNAYHPSDTYVPPKKQFLMMKTILHLYDKSRELVLQSLPVSVVLKSSIFDKVVNMKYNISNSELEKFDDIMRETDEVLNKILIENGVAQ